MVRDARSDDAAAIAKIYNHYILHTVTSFEEVKVTAREMAARIAQVQSRHLPWLVYEAESILGFAYANQFRERRAWRKIVEASVYLDAERTGQGIGVQIYSTLIERLKTSPLELRAAIGSIALPNPGSVKLHERLGFKKVGLFSEVGYKFERWIDVGFWQLDLAGGIKTTSTARADNA